LAGSTRAESVGEKEAASSSKVNVSNDPQADEDRGGRADDECWVKCRGLDCGFRRQLPASVPSTDDAGLPRIAAQYAVD